MSRISLCVSRLTEFANFKEIIETENIQTAFLSLLDTTSLTEIQTQGSGGVSFGPVSLGGSYEQLRTEYFRQFELKASTLSRQTARATVERVWTKHGLTAFRSCLGAEGVDVDVREFRPDAVTVVLSVQTRGGATAPVTNDQVIGGSVTNISNVPAGRLFPVGFALQDGVEYPVRIARVPTRPLEIVGQIGNDAISEYFPAPIAYKVVHLSVESWMIHNQKDHQRHLYSLKLTAGNMGVWSPSLEMTARYEPPPMEAIDCFLVDNGASLSVAVDFHCSVISTNASGGATAISCINQPLVYGDVYDRRLGWGSNFNAYAPASNPSALNGIFGSGHVFVDVVREGLQ